MGPNQGRILGCCWPESADEARFLKNALFSKSTACLHSQGLSSHHQIFHSRSLSPIHHQNTSLTIPKVSKTNESSSKLAEHGQTSYTPRHMTNPRPSAPIFLTKRTIGFFFSSAKFFSAISNFTLPFTLLTHHPLLPPHPPPHSQVCLMGLLQSLIGGNKFAPYAPLDLSQRSMFLPRLDSCLAVSPPRPVKPHQIDQQAPPGLSNLDRSPSLRPRQTHWARVGPFMMAQCVSQIPQPLFPFPTAPI